ncbi:MAG TPA: GNAT family N-acetyltransferase [Syntrophorhabdales bacterium]|nr:GNAT family N-acetyltransferase [Syntrophorhabdales bacterium]
MAVEIVNPVTRPNWDRLILGHANYSFFHSSAWAKVLSEAYGYKPLYFTIFDGDTLSACLPVMEVKSFVTGKRGVSLPFTDECEPLGHDPNQFEVLLNEAKAHGKQAGWKYLELRGGREFLPGIGASSTYLGHTLDLTTGEAALSGALRDSTRRNVKKAQTEGVKALSLDTAESVSQFCRLNSLTRKEHGLPPQPLGFFEKLYEHVIAKGLGTVVVASHRNTAIAAAIYLHIGEKAIYKYGASNRTHQDLRANNLVMWKAVRQYAVQGFKSLCFGRTDMDHAGLRQFKAGWGVEEYPIAYYRHDVRQNGFISRQPRTNGFSSAIFGKMPIPVLNLIGSLAYRHMG